MSIHDTVARPSLQRPARREQLYLDEMTDGWWPGVDRRCPTCRKRLFLDPPNDGHPGRIYYLMCAFEDERPVFDSRRSVAALSADVVCRQCGHVRSAATTGRVPQHWRRERCSDCWAGRLGR